MKYLVKWVKGRNEGRVEILGSRLTKELVQKGFVEIIKEVKQKPDVVIK